MCRLIDCHVHTQACGHAEGTVGDYVEAAQLAGIDALIFTEHLPLPEALDPDRHLSPAPADFERYAEQVLAASPEGLRLVLGGEADWLPGHVQFAEQTRRWARQLGVQVMLGSVHFIEDWAFDDPQNLAEWDSKDVDAVWERYFALWCDAAASGAFDVMAHPDLVKKFGHRPSRDASELYAAAAAAARSSGVVIEVSTAGLRKPVGELYPGPGLLDAFARAGVPATVGSDAHRPDEVGFGFERAAAALAQAGYDRVALPLGGGDVQWYPLQVRP